MYRLEPSAPIYEELLRRSIPVVLLGTALRFARRFRRWRPMTRRRVRRPRVTCWSSDIAASPFAGPRVSPQALERLEGYRRAHRELGCAVDDKLIFNAGTTIEEGTSAALQWIQEETGATAIQCAHDLVAIGAADTLLNQGFRVPGMSASWDSETSWRRNIFACR